MNPVERARMFGVRHAAVTGHHLATQSAFKVMTQGGSLVDAMIAASAVMTVALPHATSLGGCGMMLYFDARLGELFALNGTGTAPGLADRAMFGDNIPARGPTTWVTPGLVSLWDQAHQRFGRLPWTSLFEDACTAAMEGIGFSSEVARNLRVAKPEVTQQPGFAHLFGTDTGYLCAGERFCQPALGRTLRAIAEAGSREFYEGQTGRLLIGYAQEAGGLLRRADLAAMRAEWVTPVRQAVWRNEICVMPPNSLGVLMLAQLDALQPYLNSDPIDRAHAQIQIARLCIERLMPSVADPATNWPVSLDGTEIGRCLAARGPQADPSVFSDPGDTAGIVLADAEGNALVMLQSVFQPFGSGCVDPATGILLNNRLMEFDLDPVSSNVLAPFKRPIHTLNPYMVFKDGRPHLLAVSPGGISQTTTGVQVICNSCVDSMPLTLAIDSPRWSISRDGGVLLEVGFADRVGDMLRQQGTPVQTNSRHPFYFGSAKAIRFGNSGVMEVAADHRRQAFALSA